MAQFKNLKIFSGTSNRKLAQEIADYLQVSLGNAVFKKIPLKL